MELIDKKSVQYIALGALGSTIAAGEQYVAYAPLSYFATLAIFGHYSAEEVGEKIVYKNYALNGSFANYKRQVAGLKWTPIRTLKQLSKKKKDSFYVNNFRAEPRVKNRVGFISSFLLSRFYKKDLYLDWEALKKGSLIVGSMGQGKTEFLNNIIAQYTATNRRLVIHDTKGEFISFFYRKNKDYILNFLDERGVFWDIFTDIENGLNVSLVLEFFNAYFFAVAGDKGDKFWQASAAERFKEIFLKVMSEKELSNLNKLDLLSLELQKYIQEADESDNKTEQSIAATLKVNLDVFFRNNFFARTGHRSFTITRFFKQKDARLFLHTIEVAKERNLPFFTSFLTLMFKYQLSFFNKAENKDYVLYVLDEYLDFFTKFKEDIRISLHTKARSYGALLLPAMQFLPKDEKLRQLLISSVENLFLFAVTDIVTIQAFKNLLGKVRIIRLSKKGKGEVERTEAEIDLLDDNVLKNLRPGLHLTYLPKKNILYLGYTRLKRIEKTQPEYLQLPLEIEEKYINFLEEIKQSLDMF